MLRTPLVPLLPLLVPVVVTAQTRTVPLPEAGSAYRVSVALGDVDGDGIDDLVVGNNGTFQLRRGQADAPARRFAAAVALTPTVECSCEHAGQPRLVDVDGDGDLDLVSLHTAFGQRDRVVWFANDGRGAFAAPVPLSAAAEREFDWVKAREAGAVELVDWDRDGHLDLLVATSAVELYRGGSQGFAAQAVSLGVQGKAMAVVDWNGDGALDLLVVTGDGVALHLREGDGLAAGVPVAKVQGDPGQARLAVADWDGDGQPDVLLGENLTVPAPAADPAEVADQQRRLAAAERVLAAVAEAVTGLNATRPPRDDAEAMARRAALRDELDAWAAGPRAARDELVALLRARSGGVQRGAVRVLLR